MSHNLAARTKEERERINVDLAASGVVYRERGPLGKRKISYAKPVF